MVRIISKLFCPLILVEVLTVSIEIPLLKFGAALTHHLFVIDVLIFPYFSDHPVESLADRGLAIKR